MTMQDYLEAVLWVAAIGSTLYFIFYAFRPWWLTAQGRALMVMSAGKVLWLDLTLAAVLWPTHLARPWVFAAAFTVWVVGIAYLLISLLFSPGSRKHPPWSWFCALCRRGRAS